jgi:DNA-binding LacI/PurR family transcriptional regulator
MSVAEVAKAAGVSTATVSRVLNDMAGVRSDTVRRVRTVARELNYRLPHKSNPPRRSDLPRRARTHNIALITVGETCISWLHQPLMASVLAGVQGAAAELRLRLMLHDLPDPAQACSLIERRQIDGAVLFLPDTIPASVYEPMLSGFLSRVPLVWAMGGAITLGGVDHVVQNNIRIGQLAVGYLQELGCSELAFLSADPASPTLRLRGQSFINSALDAGYSPTAFLLTEDEMLAESYGRRVVFAGTLESLIGKFIEHRPRADGLFVANDATTAMLYHPLKSHGIGIEDKLKIVSCDNEEIRLSALDPRPATIDTNAYAIGYQSVQCLQMRIDGYADSPLMIQIRPTLVRPLT